MLWNDPDERPIMTLPRTFSVVVALAAVLAFTGCAATGGGMGHGGMDYVMKWRIVQCLRAGLPLDQDVYDAATWSAVAPLSESSVLLRGNAFDFPDFTRGGWQERPPLEITI